MKFDRCPDHDLTLSFCRPILFIQTLCFLCYLLFKFSSFLGFAEAKRGRRRLRHFGRRENPFVSFAAFCSNSLPAFCEAPFERRLLGWRSQRIKSRAAAEGIVKRLTKVTQARVAYFQRRLADVEFARP